MVNRQVNYEDHGTICMTLCFHMFPLVTLVFLNASYIRFRMPMPAAVQTGRHVVLVTTLAEKAARKNYSAMPHNSRHLY